MDVRSGVEKVSIDCRSFVCGLFAWFSVDCQALVDIAFVLTSMPQATTNVLGWSNALDSDNLGTRLLRNFTAP